MNATLDLITKAEKVTAKAGSRPHSDALDSTTAKTSDTDLQRDNAMEMEDITVGAAADIWLHRHNMEQQRRTPNDPDYAVVGLTKGRMRRLISQAGLVDDDLVKQYSWIDRVDRAEAGAIALVITGRRYVLLRTPLAPSEVCRAYRTLTGAGADSVAEAAGWSEHDIRGAEKGTVSPTELLSWWTATEGQKFFAEHAAALRAEQHEHHQAEQETRNAAVASVKARTAAGEIASAEKIARDLGIGVASVFFLAGRVQVEWEEVPHPTQSWGNTLRVLSRRDIEKLTEANHDSQAGPMPAAARTVADNAKSKTELRLKRIIREAQEALDDLAD